MERIYTTAIVGGGAAGLFLATLLNENDIAVFERNERVGRKLSATGNGQGNVTNVHAKTTPYFSLSSGGARAQTLVQKYDDTSLCAHLERCGLLLVSDERGRVYPAGRQASAITDALRFRAAQKGADVVLFGHTHEPYLHTVAAGERVGERTLSRPMTLFNPGSIGYGGSFGHLLLTGETILLSFGSVFE